MKFKIESKAFERIQYSHHWKFEKIYSFRRFRKPPFIHLFIQDMGFLIPDFLINILGFQIHFHTGHHEWWFYIELRKI